MAIFQPKMVNRIERGEQDAQSQMQNRWDRIPAPPLPPVELPKKKFSFHDWTLSAIVLRMERKRKDKEMAVLIKEISEALSETREKHDKVDAEFFQKLQEKSAARRKMDFSKERNPRLLEAFDIMIKNEKERRDSRTLQETIDAIPAHKRDPLAFAIMRWNKIDFPHVCKQLSEMVHGIEADYTEKNLRHDKEKFAEIYQLLEKADPKELFPYQFSEDQDQTVDLPESDPVEEQALLTYKWICSSRINFQTMYSVCMHKAFVAAQITQNMFQLISDLEENQNQRIDEMAREAGIEMHQHIDCAALEAELYRRVDFNEACVMLWKMLKNGK